MVLKNIDDKSSEIKKLEELLEKSQSESQKELIKKDYFTRKNGYEAEKKSAYLIDFYLKDSENTYIIHDLRLIHNGLTAQIDHLLINRLEIVLLESKSFKGMLQIKKDGSLEVSYGNKIVTYSNPLEQSKRHLEVLKSILKDNNLLKNHIGREPIFKCYTIISPETNIKNYSLPDNFYKADSFISKWKEDAEKASFFKATKMLLSMKSRESICEIGEFLISRHKPAKFDYEKKYVISKKEPIEEIKQEIEIETIEKDTEVKDIQLLISALKKYRYETATKNKIKPYIVFLDKTIAEILEKLPTTKDDLLKINGLGNQKVDEYGDDIINIVKKYLEN